MADNLKKLARQLAVFGEFNRLKIIKALAVNEKRCVSEVAKTLHLSTAVISYHLRELANEKIVLPVRQWKMICYKLVNSKLLHSIQKLLKAK